LKYSAGVVYEIRHVFNLNLYNKMPQGSATRACAEGRIEVQQPNAGNEGTPPCTADTTAATAATTAGDAADLVSATPKRKHANESLQKTATQATIPEETTVRLVSQPHRSAIAKLQ
jgi:hypothetical protein